MNLLSKGYEKARIATKEDAKALMRALSDYDCKETVSRQELDGMRAECAFKVCFGEIEIAVCSQDDALMVSRWMLDLNCDEVSIKRSANA